MIDDLVQTGEGVCRNCGGKIVHLVGSLTREHWTHEANDKGRFNEHCPGAPVATPVVHTDEHEGFRDRLLGGCGDCAAYTEVVTPVGQETTVTIFHDLTCPGRKVRHEVKPDVLPDWPEQ